MIYSSETGFWETKEVHCNRYMVWSRLKQSVSLNGILYWLASIGNEEDASYVVSYDLYNNSGNDNLECRTIYLFLVLNYIDAIDVSREQSQPLLDP